MVSNSQLGSNLAIPGSEFTYGQPAPYGEQVIVSAYNSSTFSHSADVYKLFGNYTARPHLSFNHSTAVQMIPVLGLIDRFLLEATTIDITDEIIAGDRSVVRYLRRQDPGHFPANGQPLPAIQEFEAYSGSLIGGTWDLVFTLQDGSTVTVTNQYNDGLAEIQSNIDTAMAGQILGYTAGDIQVSGDVIGEQEVITGQILAYGGGSVPTGYLECDGTQYATTTYPDLFSVIGYTYGGSGANFNVPDFRGRSLLGEGTGGGLTARARGDTAGQEAITDVPAHDHAVAIPCHSTTGVDTTPVDAYPAPSVEDEYAFTFDDTMASFDSGSTGNASVNTMPPFGVVKYLIKT